MKDAKNILQAVESANKKNALLVPGDRLLLGLSGGPDSSALLKALLLVRRKYGLTLAAAHLNHGLSRDAGKYEACARRLCEESGIPFYVKRVDVRKKARMLGRSLEEAARLERYAFFEEAAAKSGSCTIATAHTLDDQAETMLMRILRGSGLRGLAGIPALRRQGRFRVVRPLIELKKSELEAWLRKNRVKFCVDRSNRDTLFFRNRVRHALLPLLEKKFNPSVRIALAGLQQVSLEAQDYLEKASEKSFKKALRRSTQGRVQVRLSGLLKEHAAVQREVVLKAIERAQGDLKRIEFSHVSAILSLCTGGRQRTRQVHLPGKLRARVQGGILEISRP